MEMFLETLHLLERRQTLVLSTSWKVETDMSRGREYPTQASAFALMNWPD